MNIYLCSKAFSIMANLLMPLSIRELIFPLVFLVKNKKEYVLYGTFVKDILKQNCNHLLFSRLNSSQQHFRGKRDSQIGNFKFHPGGESSKNKKTKKIWDLIKVKRLEFRFMESLHNTAI